MQRILLLTTIVVLFISSYLPLSHSGVPNSRYEAMMKRESQLPGLYDENDKVVILTGDNFKHLVVGKGYASLVEFYNSYCGHCKRFAPIYKDLAESTWPWRDVIKVMAIDCAAEENNDVCREYEVMAYPTMRYFGPNYQPSPNNYGTPIMNQNPAVIQESLSKLAANETAPSNSWPNFSNLTEDEVVNLFQRLPEKIKYVVIVLIPQGNSTTGAETILNFNRYPELHVRQVADEKLAGKFYINTTHRIGAIDRNVGVELLQLSGNTSKEYKEAVAKFVSLNQLSEKPDVAADKDNQTNALLEELLRTEAEKEKEIIKEVKRNKHMVYQADLEQAIHHILNNEIPRVPEISGERLLALQRLMNVLKRYHPLGPNGRVLIDKLQEFVAVKNQLITGKEFEDKVKQLETELSPVFSSSRYIGCMGSKQNLRGFTCSLWKLFHFLSVQAYVGEKSNDPLEVLQALHGFVKYYFGCTDCSQHFQEMSQRRKIWSTPSKDEAVLWLWEAHNEVNNRLAGDDTEDPEFPKLQFPTKSSCQQCQKNTTNPQEPIVWDRDAVLSFLTNINNPSYISRYGLDDPDILQPSIDKLRQKRMIGNVFSDMDMRMGMLLYGFCIVMMILAFKLFAFKGYRKKPYVHDFLGKV